MKLVKLAVAGSMLGALLSSAAMAQQSEGTPLLQPASVQNTAYTQQDYVSFAPPAGEGASDSPSNRPAVRSEAPAPVPVPQVAADPAGGAPADAASEDDADKPWTLPQPCFLKCRGITLGGWTDSGFTLNDHNPTPNFNGVTTFPDRAGKLLLDQQWLFLDKPINNDGCGFAVGGHIDLVYGSDAFFTQATGLETKWKQENYYQLAMPQFYTDVAYDDLTIRIGHFYTILGYEVVQAPQNAFYTHSYAFQYGEPFTHTGALAMYKVNDNLTVQGGIHRGNDIFDPIKGIGADHLGFLGGFKWVDPCKRYELAWGLSTSTLGYGDQTDIMSTVATVHLTEKLNYVFQSDYGYSSTAAPGGTHANWYGVNQYWLYQINKCWSAGSRLEWFRDENGARVTGLRADNPEKGSFFPGDFWEITLGLNWKPTSNFVARPEVRWDWYDDKNKGVAFKPFDNGNRSSQFLVGCDFILTY